jgi:hypothetical protein
MEGRDESMGFVKRHDGGPVNEFQWLLNDRLLISRVWSKALTYV